MNSYHREITDFLSDYGAVGIEIVSGGKHPKVEFEFRGKHVAYTIANSPSDHRASANLIGDLKRLLGEPVIEEAKEPRHLSNMLPAAVERPTFAGKVALYGSKHSPPIFRFFLPKTLIDAAGISLGQMFKVFMLDQHTWHFKLITDDGERHPTLTEEKNNKTFFVVRAAGTGLTKLGPFGVSPAAYSIVDDTIIVYLPPETMSTRLDGRVPKAARKTPPLVAPAPYSPPQPAAALVADTNAVPVADRLRMLLAVIRATERQTGYRLLRVRRDDQQDGVWTWRAPEIRLDDE